MSLPDPTTAAAWWYIAECRDCEPVLPQPFRDEGARDEWVGEHFVATGHTAWRASWVPATERSTQGAFAPGWSRKCAYCGAASGHLDLCCPDCRRDPHAHCPSWPSCTRPDYRKPCDATDTCGRCGANAWHRFTMRHSPTVEVLLAECASCRHVRAVEVRNV